MKREFCKKCGQHLIENETWYKSDYIHVRYVCIPCKKAQGLAWRKRNPERVIKQWKKWNILRYGITPAQVKELLQTQKGLCKICNKALIRYYIDHCHTTKVVRGLLCPGCNNLLGHIENRNINLQRIFQYLNQKEN